MLINFTEISSKNVFKVKDFIINGTNSFIGSFKDEGKKFMSSQIGWMTNRTGSITGKRTLGVRILSSRDGRQDWTKVWKGKTLNRR